MVSGLGDALETTNSTMTMVGARRGERRRGGDADLPRPNLAEEDGYGGGGVKMSAVGASMSATRSRQRSSSSPATMK